MAAKESVPNLSRIPLHELIDGPATRCRKQTRTAALSAPTLEALAPAFQLLLEREVFLAIAVACSCYYATAVADLELFLKPGNGASEVAGDLGFGGVYRRRRPSQILLYVLHVLIERPSLFDSADRRFDFLDPVPPNNSGYVADTLAERARAFFSGTHLTVAAWHHSRPLLLPLRQGRNARDLDRRVGDQTRYVLTPSQQRRLHFLRQRVALINTGNALEAAANVVQRALNNFGTDA